MSCLEIIAARVGTPNAALWLGTVAKIVLFAVWESRVVGLVVNKLYPWYH